MQGGRRGHAAGGLFVVALPGYHRFGSGLSNGFFTRAVVRAFPDGELHTDVPQQVEERRCVIVGSISPPAGNFERLTLVAHALRRAGAERITALLPYLAYARQDRAARTESLGLAWAGGLLRASGVDEVVWARKRRTAGGVEHLGLVGHPGRRAIVVDDILDTGDTLVSCCRALRDAGVRDLRVIVTHGLFTGTRGRALLSEGVGQIRISDTVLSRRRPPRACVLPVAPPLAPVLEEVVSEEGSDA